MKSVFVLLVLVACSAAQGNRDYTNPNLTTWTGDLVCNGCTTGIVVASPTAGQTLSPGQAVEVEVVKPVRDQSVLRLF